MPKQIKSDSATHELGDLSKLQISEPYVLIYEMEVIIVVIANFKWDSVYKAPGMISTA